MFKYFNFLFPVLVSLNLTGTPSQAQILNQWVNFASPSGVLCEKNEKIQNIVLNQLDKILCTQVTTHDLKSIISLDLSDQEISSLSTEDFKGFYSLQKLDLSDNQITELPANLFDDSAYLIKLNLSNNQITHLAPGLFDNLTYLNTLDLSDNQITSFSWDLFEDSIYLTNLDISDNQITNSPPVSGITHLNRLANSVSPYSPEGFFNVKK